MGLAGFWMILGGFGMILDDFLWWFFADPKGVSHFWVIFFGHSVTFKTKSQRPLVVLRSLLDGVGWGSALVWCGAEHQLVG